MAFSQYQGPGTDFPSSEAFNNSALTNQLVFRLPDPTEKWSDLLITFAMTACSLNVRFHIFQPTIFVWDRKIETVKTPSRKLRKNQSKLDWGLYTGVLMIKRLTQ
jgi:hypothetical protein